MLMTTMPPLENEEGLHQNWLHEAQSESGRWRLVAQSLPDGGVTVSLWLHGDADESHGLVRRWKLTGPLAAKRFHGQIARKLGEVPESASASAVLGHLPMQVESQTRKHRSHWRGIPPVTRLSGA